MPNEASQNNHLEQLVLQVAESLTREIGSLREQMTTGFSQLNARLDTQAARLDRQAALLETGSR